VLARETREAVDAFVRAQAEGGVMGTWPYEAKMPDYRGSVARFLGASEDEIAILRNTSDGANVVARGLDWRTGDEVILPSDEFPANAIPWLALRDRGVNVRFVNTQRGRLTPEVLAKTIAARTRVVTLSWVSYADGYRHDLAALGEIAHAHGALLCVDAIQGLGAFPLDVHACGIDVLYAGGAKWLMALQGVGILYVHASLLDRFAVPSPGWRSVADMWDFHNYDQPPVRNASRFEGGTPNFAGALSLDRSIGVLEQAGAAAIGQHVLALTDRLCEGLARGGADVRSIRGEGCSSGIVLFRVPGCESIALGKALQAQGIITTWRANGIRVAPHGYNTVEEIDALLGALPRCASALLAP
jgi:cysteine desulfurase/selenocysteine lyase